MCIFQLQFKPSSWSSISSFYSIPFSFASRLLFSVFQAAESLTKPLLVSSYLPFSYAFLICAFPCFPFPYWRWRLLLPLKLLHGYLQTLSCYKCDRQCRILARDPANILLNFSLMRKKWHEGDQIARSTASDLSSGLTRPKSPVQSFFCTRSYR